MQKGLPRSSAIDIDAMFKIASEIQDPIKAAIAREAALLEANDALRYPVPGAKVRGVSKPVEALDDDLLAQARLMIAREVSEELAQQGSPLFQAAWEDAQSSSLLPGLSGYEDEIDEHQMLIEAFDVSFLNLDDPEISRLISFQNVQDSIVAAAEKGNKMEKKLALHLGGYQNRAKMLRQKIGEASEALGKATHSLDSFRTLQISEEAAISRRLEGLRSEVEFISKREREAQDLYRARMEELTSLGAGTNGYH